MREEVEGLVKEEGWTKVALKKMDKVDSFLRESQRMCGIGACESVNDISSVASDGLLQ